MLNILSYVKNPRLLGISLLTHFGGWIPDIVYLKWMYYLKMRRRLNLKHPSTFNEKLQWLKLFYRKPEYTNMVDKCEVKKYVSGILGPEFVIPSYGVWDRLEDIDFSILPSQFVLKATNGGGNCGIYICKDKTSIDKGKVFARLSYGLSQNIYKDWREWPYKGVKPRIIAEAYMEDTEYGELRDYKFFCFDGVVKALFVGTDRQKPGEDVKFDFFDADYNHLPFKQGHEWASTSPAKPKSFEIMKECAAKLSKGFPHVRIDMYEVDGCPYFGEMTFYHFGGMVPFVPEEWDKRFGDWIVLPEKERSMY